MSQEAGSSGETSLASGSVNPDGARSYALIATKGSLFNSGQWAVNKLVTALAMLVIAKYLSPDDYGVAAQSLAILGYAVILSPVTVGDVLVAHPREFGSLAKSGNRMAIGLGAGMGIFTLLLIPLCIGAFHKYPPGWLGGLLAVLALKPLGDGALTVPLTRLRLDLKYRAIALIDGVVQFLATILSLAMAVLGARGAALVVPQVIASFVRAIWYRLVSRQSQDALTQPASDSFRTLVRGYVPGVAAQYIHNVILGLEVITLGLFAGDYQTGLFGFSFTLAAQANTVIAYQLGVVLQPVLGQLRDEPIRQVEGFLRAQRLLGLVCVPVSLAQAAVAESLFRVAFAAKWEPAIPVFQIISLAQSFYFVAGPSMACLRSQRRFTTFFWWQAVQFAVAGPVYALAARWNGAVGVALASGCIWLASSLIVLWMCTWPAPRPILRTFGQVFLKPLVTSIPLAIASWWLGGCSSLWGATGPWINLLGIVPLSLLITLVAQRWVDPEYRDLFDGALRAVVRRLSRPVGERSLRH